LFAIDYNEDGPYYLKVYRSLKKSITSGEVKPGEQFYTYNTLVAHFNTSRVIVNMAIERLKLEHYLDAIRKRTIVISLEERMKRVNIDMLAQIKELVENKQLEILTDGSFRAEVTSIKLGPTGEIVITVQ